MEERKRAADVEKQGGFRAGAARARARLDEGAWACWARGRGGPERPPWTVGGGTALGQERISGYNYNWWLVAVEQAG